MKGKYLIFSIIVVQSILLVAGGILAVDIAYDDYTGENVYVYDTYIGGLSKDGAVKKLKNSLGKTFENDVITLKVDEKYEYNISCSDIELSLDYNAIVQKACEVSKLDRLFSGNKKSVLPEFKFNEPSLRKFINELSVLVNKEPVDAKVLVKSGEVEKIPGESGLKINIDNSVKKFKDEINKDIDFVVEFSSVNNFEIEIIPPSLTLQDVWDIEEIIAQYSIRIESKDDLPSTMLASQAIHNVIVNPISRNNDNEVGYFSFNQYLQEAGALKYEGDEGYNQVASCLYAAVLMAGMDTEFITRTCHESYVDYIEPGMDVKASSNNEDFKFANTGNGKFMVLSEVCNDKLYVRILGRKRSNEQRIEIKTEIAQIYEPSIINLEDASLKPGEKKVVSPGKKGFKVQVYRVTYNNDIKTKQEYLYTDIYKAVKSVVKIGPDTEWVREIDK